MVRSNTKSENSGIVCQEVVSKYQGFEGELVCFFEIKENANDFKKMEDECLALKKLGSCFLLHVLSSPSGMPFFLTEQAIKLGYDVGVCEENTIYSSIFHEILFGIVEELVIYKNLLNEKFLFPNRFLAEKYVKEHNQMSV